MAFNGPECELPACKDDLNHCDESVYCVACGTIFVRNPTARDCPSCTLADRLEEIKERLDRAECDIDIVDGGF